MKKQVIFMILILAFSAAACGGQAGQQVSQPVEQDAVVSMPEAENVDVAPVEVAPVEASSGEAQEEAPQPVEPASGQTGLTEYAVPEDLFNISIPSAWTLTTDTTTLEKTVVDTATSPDGNAFVQILANKVGYALDNVLKGQVTLDYMKRLYGKDLRIATDVTLPDGREKLEWWSEENKTSGTTYFDMQHKHLYYFTVGYKDKFEEEYASVLKEVTDSFSY